MLVGRIPAKQYKKYEKTLKSVITCSKKFHERISIQNSQCPARTVWNLVGKYTGKTRGGQDFKILNLKQTPEQSDVDVLNYINKFYLNMCPSLNVNYDIIRQQIKNHKKTLFLHPVDSTEIKNIVQNLKNKKSVGQDQIPTNIIKYVSSEIEEPLTHIINLMLFTGTFPSLLKTALIKPIYKKGDKNNIKNYRPIALLNNISKIFEKVINDRLMTFLEREKLLSDFQSGFRQGKSTIRAVYQALYKVIESMNNGKPTVAMYLDLSKAFDSVDHDVLLLKLERYGIRGKANELIKSYLSNREQCVIATDQIGNQIFSQREKVKRGVPQGSILGPLLYIIYTNELSSLTQNAFQFADDTSVIISIDPKEEEHIKILDTLSVLENWFSSNNLLLNVEKTQLIKFNYQTNPGQSIYQDETRSLQTVSSATFLGIEVDHRLDWRQHTDILSSKIAKYCYALKVLANNINTDTAIMAYHAYVQSKIRYGIIFWARGVEAIRVFRLQKRCIRSIFNLKSAESCKSKFIETKIFTLYSLLVYEAVVFVKKNLNLFEHCDRDHHHLTRQKENLKDLKYRFAYLQKNVHSSLIKIFNKIPIDIRQGNITSLKRFLKRLLVSRAYYTLEEFLQDTL